MASSESCNYINGPNDVSNGLFNGFEFTYIIYVIVN